MQNSEFVIIGFNLGSHIYVFECVIICQVLLSNKLDKITTV